MLCHNPQFTQSCNRNAYDFSMLISMNEGELEGVHQFYNYIYK